ncbi:Outer membrane protein (porin) [Paraburkholderia fungorum]|uniref:Outer membrane protein (Porin) n=1 Tax=Paraburkholderia fungorum TaxID=134537 RepID=A0A1H1JVI3_9BURK|nr:porin [Paraburkholderia fungorum]SDR53739.1 Outer membrane protein (porin) [Paraburkholderia fungorum]
MKRWLFSSLLGLVVTGPVFAQSSVTLYGLISEGVMYTNNSGGKSLVQLASSIQQTPRIGLKGVEDLGGGTKAIFTLENGFSVTTGKLGNGSRLFGRTADVGIKDDTFGTITAGRQYDAIGFALGAFEAAQQFATIGVPIGEADNLFRTYGVDNMVQYQSPTIGGFQFMSAYAFSNEAGGFSDNNSMSVGVSYNRGPVAAAVGYIVAHRPNDSNTTGAIYGDYGFDSPFITSPGGADVAKQQMLGAGASYKLSTYQLSLLYTHTLFGYLDNSRTLVSNYEATVTDYLTPSFIVGLGYIFTNATYAPSSANPKWHQVDAGTDWFISKLTDLYCTVIYQKAAGSAQYAEIYDNGASSSRSQVSAMIGIRHKF